MNCPITPHVERLVELAIEEDLGRGDVTTDALVLHREFDEGRIVAREDLVVCGLDLAEYVAVRISPHLSISSLISDGDEVTAGTEVLVVTGPVEPILQAERVVLNFLMRMCGVATATRRYVKLVSATGAKARIVDTRKTIPGWRMLDKYAVSVGGAANHRVDLGSGILIKDNHIAACGSVWEAVTRARRQAPHSLRIEVEVKELSQIEEALEAKADAILLDNMEPEMLREAVQRVKDRVLLEASGGVNQDTVAAIALTGVDLISVGRLTHSARAADLAMELTQR